MAVATRLQQKKLLTETAWTWSRKFHFLYELKSFCAPVLFMALFPDFWISWKRCVLCGVSAQILRGKSHDRNQSRIHLRMGDNLMLNRHSRRFISHGNLCIWQTHKLANQLFIISYIKKCVIHAKDLFISGRVIWLMAKRTYASFSLEFDQIDSESSHELDSQMKFPALL